MKALSYCQPLLLEGKKYPAAKYIGKKYLALHFYRKKISVLFPWAEKKLLHSLNLPTPPPPPPPPAPQKSNGPPLLPFYFTLNFSLLKATK
jgi:hypothetical protein